MVKESFQFLWKAIEKSLPAKTLLDVGCGDGAFLRYVRHQCPEIQLFGFDCLPSILGKAAKLKTPALLYQGSIECPMPEYKNPYDLITMTGVHSEFSSPNEWIDNLLSFGHEKSTYFVMGYFNPHPMDILVTWSLEGKTYEFRGFNIISQRTMLEAIRKRGYKGRFDDFQLTSPIAKKSDPTRCWTFRNQKGKLLQTNGACQLVPFKLLTIRNF